MTMNIFYITCRKLNVTIHKHFLSTRLRAPWKNICKKNKYTIILGTLPLIPTVSAQSVEERSQIVSSSIIGDFKNDPTKSDLSIFKEKTPWERVKAIFEKDEFGNYSKEWITILHGCYMAGFVGMIYGGVLKSRIAFLDFMERNQATMFDNHIDAKRRLQNHVTIHFGKGAFYWGWRMTLFTGTALLTFTCLNAYRGSTSVIDYSISGAIAGALMRIKLGPPGIIVGGLVGGVLGLISGVANQSVLAFFGASFDDILVTQYKLDRERAMLMEANHVESQAERGDIPKDAVMMLKEREALNNDK